MGLLAEKGADKYQEAIWWNLAKSHDSVSGTVNNTNYTILAPNFSNENTTYAKNNLHWTEIIVWLVEFLAEVQSSVIYKFHY